MLWRLDFYLRAELRCIKSSKMPPKDPTPTPTGPSTSSIIAELSNKIPRFETRKALLILNIQNDTFTAFDEFYMCKPHDFRQRIMGLVPYFRALGDIVWVNTELEDADLATSHEPASPQKPRQKGRAKSKRKASQPETVQSTAEAGPSGQQIFHDSATQYFSTSKAKAAMQKASPQVQAKMRSDELEALASDFEMGTVPFGPREGPSAVIYKSGTPGAAFTEDALACKDQERDLVVIKRHYSAFDSTSLLMSLRMKLVTHIYLAGALTNRSVLTTAIDAVRHGFEVSIVEDCLGYRSEARHVEAMRKMADELGASGVDSEEIMDEAGGRRPPDADENILTGPGLSGIQALVPPEGGSPQESPISSSSFKPTGKNEGDEESGRRASADANPGLTSIKKAANETLDSGIVEPAKPKSPWPRKKEGEPKLGPADHIGEGDSKIIINALSITLAEEAFKLVKREVDWRKMLHRSGEVPRRVAVQGEIGSDGSVPIYRHPADESPPLLNWTPTVQRIREELQILLKQPFNHALIQLYRSGQDFISEHSDKTLDVVRGSSIINMSLGAQRTMTLRTKKSMHAKGDSKDSVERQTQRIPMPHNSVFVLGSRTNAKWLHGVRPDKRLAAERMEEEKAFGSERISLTFRHIGTFTNLDRTRIWGQGAISKIQATAGQVSTSDSDEMEAMVIAFGKENQQADCDWDAEYGRGFDALNLVVASAPAEAKNSSISDLPKPPIPSVETKLRDIYAKNACDDPWSIERYSACRVLKDNGIPCYIWSEDALSYYGVPTAVFDVHIVVDDVEEAMEVLVGEGWSPPPPGFEARYTHIKEATHYLVRPGVNIGKTDLTAVGHWTTLVAIMDASEWNVKLPHISSPTYHPPKRDDRWPFIPPLHELLDPLIQRWLVTPDEHPDFRGHLGIFLGYLYSHVSILQMREFAPYLKKEHRQYHFDKIAGVSVISEVYREHQRNIRELILKGEYELCHCSAESNDERFFTKEAEARLWAALAQEGQ